MRQALCAGFQYQRSGVSESTDRRAHRFGLPQTTVVEPAVLWLDSDLRFCCSAVMAAFCRCVCRVPRPKRLPCTGGALAAQRTGNVLSMKLYCDVPTVSKWADRIYVHSGVDARYRTVRIRIPKSIETKQNRVMRLSELQ